ncbi:hypothetical protein [Priestia aryabhattai]|uniref:hypothetical protein n=1 Tax=Priestia aryabhattai TaxID=412384 RepID=UPI002E222454|nr:hypothetical protein [Priestia aryabhattai]
MENNKNNAVIAILMTEVMKNSLWDTMRDLTHLGTPGIIFYTLAFVATYKMVSLCVKKIQHANAERKRRKELEEKQRFLKFLDEYTSSK